MSLERRKPALPNIPIIPGYNENTGGDAIAHKMLTCAADIVIDQKATGLGGRPPKMLNDIPYKTPNDIYLHRVTTKSKAEGDAGAEIEKDVMSVGFGNQASNSAYKNVKITRQRKLNDTHSFWDLGDVTIDMWGRPDDPGAENRVRLVASDRQPESAELILNPDTPQAVVIPMSQDGRPTTFSEIDAQAAGVIYDMCDTLLRIKTATQNPNMQPLIPASNNRGLLARFLGRQPLR